MSWSDSIVKLFNNGDTFLAFDPFEAGIYENLLFLSLDDYFTQSHVLGFVEFFKIIIRVFVQFQL